MPNNPFYHTTNLTPPAYRAFSITPSDSTDLSIDIRAVTIGTSGILSYINPEGAICTTADLPVGTYPLFARRIRATGTTASQITGWV